MTPLPRPPLWLARPSRFAGMKPTHALAVLIGLSLLLLASTGVPTATVTGSGGSVQTDLGLYEAIVAGLRAGGDYYTLTAQALRAGDYPLRPFFTFRLPTLAVVQAAVPATVSVAALALLAAGVAAAWFVRLRELFARRPALIAALLLLAGGMTAFVQPDLIAFHEIWAGLLVALALAIRRQDRWVEAAAIALAAMLLRETAALFAIVMAGVAFAEGHRREGLGWIATLALLGLVLGIHAHAVSAVVRPLDPASAGWGGMHGAGLFVRGMVLATALQVLPYALAAPLAALALFGWAGMPGSLGLRATLTLLAYALVLALFARADNFYWALIVAPTSLVGLAFVPDGLRDLGRAILDRRRVRVQRITR